MIDLGLLASILLAAAAAWATGRLLRSRAGRVAPLDPMLSAGVAGLIGGRIAAVALDDPASLLRLRDVLIVRSGVELWPGLLVAAVAFLVITRGSGSRPVERLAAAAPVFLAGYAAYEAACLLRDGCFGPPVTLGLTPPGFAGPVFPVGLAVAAVTAPVALALRRLGGADVRDLLLALLTLAATRAVAGFHLPRVGGALSRPHLESIAVALATTALAGVIALAAHNRAPTAGTTDAVVRHG